jgi:hypothetical protein
VRVPALTVIVLAMAGLVSGAEPAPTSEPSLADRAAAASAKKRDQPSTGERKVLTNEDLKKAKGNVIYLPAPAATSAPPPAPAASTTSASDSGTAPPTGDPIRQLDELRGRALRLRTTLDAAQKERTEATTDEQREALDQRIRDTVDELTRTYESIGALSEQLKTGAEPAKEPTY